MTISEYVPAIGEQLNNAWLRKLEYNGHDMKFFTKKSFFEMDNALQSAYYGITGATKGMSYREAIGYPKHKTLIGDSGGFQYYTLRKAGQKLDMTPLQSLRWQEENCEIMMNLDTPPSIEHLSTMDEIKIALKESVENFSLFEKKRERNDNALLNVLHGHNKHTMNVWYQGVKDFNFDGWAIGNPSLDPVIHAMGLMYLHDKGEFDKDTCKCIHLFGKGGRNTVPMMAYFASKMNKKVTFDSSSYNVGSIYRKYYMPLDITNHLFFGEKFKTANPNLKELPCECPVCSNIQDIEDLNRGDLYAGCLISLHNLYQYRYQCNIMNKIVKVRDKFMEYLKDIRISKRTIQSIEFIDFCLNNDFDTAIKRFERILIPQETKMCKQRSIFSY